MCLLKSVNISFQSGFLQKAEPGARTWMQADYLTDGLGQQQRRIRKEVAGREEKPTKESQTMLQQ
jgi:hypothetical protein